MIEIIFYISVMAMAILTFFITFTANNSFLEFFMIMAGKAIPLFVIFYAGIELSKIFGLI